MIRILIALVLFYLHGSLNAQTAAPAIKKPKLVVGIIVDQMRFDHLYKYKDRYSDGGFLRLMQNGYNFKNTQYNYVPTVTAAGHASVYTGTTPATHGIIGNTWYAREQKKVVSNVEDPKITLIGAKEESTKGLSPHYLLSTTIGDELRMTTNYTAKVISVSLKDRGAILPGGRSANAAYWHDWETSPGYFVSSSYYMPQLPPWVSAFNELNKSSSYLDTNWNTLYPIATYTSSVTDDNDYEHAIGGKLKPTFPYDLRTMRQRMKTIDAEYQLVWVSPAGNNLLTEFAQEAIKNENLGMDDITDLLNISYTVTDIIGHTFGPQSVELEDIYLRLDRNIQSLLTYLDNRVGANDYIVFLTSDHGAMPVASYMNDRRLPAGVALVSKYREALGQFLNKKYGNKEWIENFDGEQIYLNRPLIMESKYTLAEVQQETADFMAELDGVHSALSAHKLQYENYEYGMNQRIQNGFNYKRSGDVILTLEPGYIIDSNPDMVVSDIKGTTHGSGYAYDTHVPMLWYGSGIPVGESVRKVSVTDIAPSLSLILNIAMPSGTSGEPLTEIFQKPAPNR